MENKIITLVTRKIDGSFAEKVSLEVQNNKEDLDKVIDFAMYYMLHGKAKWLEVYEGTNLYFGDCRVKPIFSSREE